MDSAAPKVLIVDDDPQQLEIYGMVLKHAKFEPVPAIVKFAGPEFPPETGIALIVLDYRLNSIKSAPEVAQEAQSKFPGAPIVVLSDLWTLPSDVAPYAAKFVRKGDPQKLIDTIRSLMEDGDGTPI
jgi:DNA-binding NtrC family response regulator